MRDDFNQLPPLGDDYLTLAELLQGAAACFPDQEAFVCEETRLTYGAWHEAAMRLGAQLSDFGFEPGQVGLIYHETSIDYAIAFAAIQAVGGISTGINLRLGPNEIGAIAAKAAPTAVLAPQGLDTPFDEAVVLRCPSYPQLADAAPLPERVPRRPHDIATIIWTSGTTGLPKGAAMNHDNLREATKTSGPLAAPFARKLNSTPFAHAGFAAKIWEQIAFGMTLVLNRPPWSAEKMLALMVDERISIGGAVPTQWAKLLELPELADADLSSLCVGITATAPAPPELVKRVTTVLGIPLIVRYSMTECPSMTGTRPGDDPEVLFNTVGRPQAGIEIELVGHNFEPVAHGEVGRIRVRAPQVMCGYWNDPEQTALVLSEDGWLLTSDLGRMRPDGNLVLAGRVSDMYIRGGYNVYPIEVERVLSDHPQVRNAAVIGREAPVIGEIGVAFVEPADPANPPTLSDLREWVGSRLADYKVPDELVLIAELPLNTVMKADKLALRGMLASANVISAR